MQKLHKENPKWDIDSKTFYSYRMASRLIFCHYTELYRKVCAGKLPLIPINSRFFLAEQTVILEMLRKDKAKSLRVLHVKNSDGKTMTIWHPDSLFYALALCPQGSFVWEDFDIEEVKKHYPIEQAEYLDFNSWQVKGLSVTDNLVCVTFLTGYFDLESLPTTQFEMARESWVQFKANFLATKEVSDTSNFVLGVCSQLEHGKLKR